MCILLYVKLIWCSGFPDIYAQLGCIHLPSVYVHSSLCETYLVEWFSRHLCSIGRYIGLWYMSILLYVKLTWCSGFLEIYSQLEEGWGQSAMDICAFCYIWNLFCVVVLHRSRVNWRRGWGQSAMDICAFCYMWNLFHVVVLHRSMVE